MSLLTSCGNSYLSFKYPVTDTPIVALSHADTQNGRSMTSFTVLPLQHLDDWSFNVFNVNSASDGHALKYVGYELLQKYDLITKFKISTSVLDTFLLALETGYGKHKNPYHNLIHGGDVAQTVHTILSQSKLVVSSPCLLLMTSHKYYNFRFKEI